VQWSGNLARQRLVLAPAGQLAGWQQLANCSATCFFSAACAASGNCCQCGAIFSCCRHQLVLAAAAATAAASGMHQVVHTAVMPVQQHWQLVAQHWQWQKQHMLATCHAACRLGQKCKVSDQTFKLSQPAHSGPKSESNSVQQMPQ